MSHGRAKKKEPKKIGTLLASIQEATAEFLKEEDEHVISQKRTLTIRGREQRHRTPPTRVTS